MAGAGHAAPINTNDRVYKSFATFLPEPIGSAVPQPTGEVAKLLGVMTGELSRQEIQLALGLKHRTYCDYGNHQGFAVLPARPYTPRDKACVEATMGPQRTSERNPRGLSE